MTFNFRQGPGNYERPPSQKELDSLKMWSQTVGTFPKESNAPEYERRGGPIENGRMVIEVPLFYCYSCKEHVREKDLHPVAKPDICQRCAQNLPREVHANEPKGH